MATKKGAKARPGYGGSKTGKGTPGKGKGTKKGTKKKPGLGGGPKTGGGLGGGPKVGGGFGGGRNSYSTPKKKY